MDRALEQGDRRLILAFGRQRGVPLVWAAPATLFLLVFFVAPLGRNAVSSDLASYTRLVADPFYVGVLGQTLALSLATAAIAALIGYPIAFFMIRRARRLQGLLIFALVAPLLTSIIMRTYGWRVLMARLGLVNALLKGGHLIERPIDFLAGPTVAIAALVHVLVPFMVLSIAASLQAVDTRLEESARVLGAGRVTTFLKVTLPLTLDGIGTGVILVFMLANGSFVTVLLLGGGLQTLPLLIFQQFNTTRDFAFASAMSNVLLVAAVTCLLLQARLIRRRGVRP
jgi:putative spermidine/putrescine transport system permease protein